MKKRALALFKDKEGSMAPLVVAVTLVMLLLLLVISEYFRLMITASGVKDALQSAVISVVNDNYNEVYHGVREGYAAGYEPSGESFAASVDTGDVYSRLCFLLGMDDNGSYLIRWSNGGELEYRLSELSVNVPNTAIAPGGQGGTYYAEASIRLEVPVRFAGNVFPYLSINLKVKAGYREKF